MQCVSDLTKLRDGVICRVRALQQIVTPVSLPLGSEERRALAFAAIELDNTIIVALRQFTKSSLLRTRTSSGLRVTSLVAPKTPEEAAAFVLQSLNLKAYQRLKSPAVIQEKDEITFRDPKRVEKVMIDYSASNLANLQLALSLNATVFSELKVCRHFFSHRMRSTFDEVKVLAGNSGILNLEDTENFLVLGRPTTGVRFLDGWLSDVQNFFDLAA